MRKILAIAALVAALSARAEDPLVYCVHGCEATRQLRLRLGASAPPAQDVFWFGPSVGLATTTLSSKTHEWTGAVAPMIGYGLKWRPTWWTITTTLVNADLFFAWQNAASSGSDVSLVPTVTLGNTVSIGYGVEFYMKDGKGKVGTLLQIGFGSALGSVAAN
jgi:hypothetical protein